MCINAEGFSDYSVSCVHATGGFIVFSLISVEHNTRQTLDTNVKKSTKKKRWKTAFTRIREEKEDDEEDNGEADIRRAEEEEEKGERRGREGYGAFKAWAEQVVDRVGVASEGCVRLACASEIERDGSVFLCRGEWRKLGGACVREGSLEIKLECL